MRTALVVCLLLLAGCNTTSPGTATGTSTPAPVPDAASHPPGVGASGVVDPVALANAHAAAAGDRYVVVSNYTVRYANGTVRTSVVQRSRVSPGAWHATISVDGTHPGVVSDTPATAEFWSDGTEIVERIRRGNQTNYLHVPAGEYNGGNGFYNSLRRPIPYRDPWALAASLETRTLETRNGSAVVAANALAAPGLFDAVVEARSPQHVSYRATVGQTGLLRDQRLAYDGEVAGEAIRVTRTIRYRPLDAPVERPDWYETAKAESVRN